MQIMQISTITGNSTFHRNFGYKYSITVFLVPNPVFSWSQNIIYIFSIYNYHHKYTN